MRCGNGFAVLHCGPCNIVGAPHIGDLPVTADTFWRYHEPRDLSWRCVGRKPEFLQCIVADPRFISVGRQQNAIVCKQSKFESPLNHASSYFLCTSLILVTSSADNPLPPAVAGNTIISAEQKTALRMSTGVPLLGSLDAAATSTFQGCDADYGPGARSAMSVNSFTKGLTRQENCYRVITA